MCSSCLSFAKGGGFNMSTRASCKLNSDGSVCLKDIVQAFNATISEEHAWALCYQCCKYYQSHLANGSFQNCQRLLELSNVYLQTDGNVHSNTFFGGSSSASSAARIVNVNEREFIRDLGLLIYQALDHGNTRDEERVMSGELSQFIEDLITEERNAGIGSHHETDDEGIEKDSEESEEVVVENTVNNIQDVVQKCEKHLSVLTKMQIETHYKAVIRAFVTEALELSTFLEKVAFGHESFGEINVSELKLEFADWARCWMQVMDSLRMGVKLRKVNYSRAPIEYELTPYEILMKDIRACRYTLRKVMVNGDVPQRITKDAHALIVEFIRSRPPLKKASDRKLKPLVKNPTPREELLDSIRKGKKLRTTKKIPSLKFNLTNSDDDGAGDKEDHSGTKKLIKIDYSLLDDDDEEEEPTQHDSSESDLPGLWPQEEYQQMWNKTLDAYDLATQDLEYHNCVRRHTLDVTMDLSFGSQSVPQSRPCSRQSYNSSEPDSYTHEINYSIHDHLANSSGKNWPEGMSLEDRLSLTLQEIVHIRSVLTKADIEALPVEARVRYDVENRKVCFLCLKTRFSIFGPWGQRCLICKKTICSRCYTKTSLPMEHFAGIPVALLSPNVLTTPEDDRRSETSSTKVTPEAESPQQMVGASSPGSQSVKSITSLENSAIGKLRSRAQAVGRAAGVVDKWKGNQRVVCHDCKMMLQQIIESARTNRTAIRNKTLQNLTLNLSPVF